MITPTRGRALARSVQGAPAGRRPAAIDHAAVGALAANRPTWMFDGACNNSGAEWVRPDNAVGQSWADEAKTFCDQCPVRKQCLAYGLANPDEQGVYGGLTDAERRRVREGKPLRAARPKPAKSTTQLRREQVAQLMEQGLGKFEISDQLGIDVRTAQRYMLPALPSWMRPETRARLDQVRELVADGLSTPQIADKLGITDSKVKRYRRLIKAEDSQAVPVPA